MGTMTATNEELDKSFQSPPREDMIQTAVKFLQNKNVVSTALAQKQKFLQRKGLSDEEIQIACERSGAYALHENQSRVPPSPPVNTSIPVPYYGYRQVQLTFFDKVKEIVHNLALFSAVAYAIYKFYEKFIKPFLFGAKKKSIEDSLDDLQETVTQSVKELKDDMSNVKIEVDKIAHLAESTTQRQLSSLQSDLNTVKGLLLSRKQFPSVSNSPVVPPSIPAWQLSSVTAEPDSDTKGEELMEIGSGSGSSDPEHATKTSDSSLEIIS